MRHPPLRNPYRVLLLLSQLSHPESPRLSKIDILVGAGPRPARRTEFDSKREKTEGEDREGKRELELASFNREGSSPPPTILPPSTSLPISCFYPCEHDPRVPPPLPLHREPS